VISTKNYDWDKKMMEAHVHNDQTPLPWAARNAHEAAVRLLVEKAQNRDDPRNLGGRNSEQESASATRLRIT
jgi:ankyrin repeat protein